MTTTLDDPLRTARREELAGKVRAWLRADESSTVVDVKNADPLEDGFVADMMRFMGNDNVDTRSLVSGKSAVLDEIVSMVDGDTDVVSLGVDDLVEVEASGQVEVCGEDVAPDFGDRDNLAKKFSAAYAARERRRTMRRQRDARTIISQTTSGGFTDDPVVTDLLARLQAATPVSRTAIAATLAALSEEQLQLLASAMEGASSLQLDDATVCMLCETLFPDGDQVVSRAYHSYVALVRAVLLRRIRSLTAAPSRPLVAAVRRVFLIESGAVLEGLVVPLLCVDNSSATEEMPTSGRAELVRRMVKEATAPQCVAMLNLLAQHKEHLHWTDGLISTIQTLLARKPLQVARTGARGAVDQCVSSGDALFQDVWAMFGTALDRVPSLAGNVKFTALLWATVDQRKEAVGCSIVQSASPAIHELAMRITTFHKKKLLDVANLGSACAT